MAAPRARTRPEQDEADAVRGAGARVLVCGMSGLAAETCKNIVLAGASRHTCPSPMLSHALSRDYGRPNALFV
jgi:hypothetical protein